MKRLTIGDIARRAGVSHAAVSYALNGHPGVSDRTRRRIVAIAEELGWEPSSTARALVGARADAVGLVMARPARMLAVEPIFTTMLSGLEQVLGERSVALLLQVVPDMETQLSTYRRWWNGRRVDGVVMADLEVDDPRLPVLEQLGMPAVVMADIPATATLSVIRHDDGQPMRSLLHYLVAMGHRRIARICGPSELAHTATRTAAMMDVVAELSLPVPALVNTDYTGEQGSAAIREQLSLPQRPTAIICDNDVMAVAGLGVAQELGLSVPADVSVIAWDDSALCRLTHPPLTALSRDVTGQSAAAAEVLLQMIAGEPGRVSPASGARLVPRGSTGPPRR